MATAEVDIPEPVCETIREEEERKMVDQAANKVTKEEKTSTDNTPDEPPETLESNFDVKDVKKSSEGSASTIESENFLRSPLIAEVSFEAKNHSDACKITEKSEKITKDDTDISPPGNAKLDDQPLEITGSEETILEGIEENAEESNGKYGEKNTASVLPSTVDSAVSTSETKAGDIIYGLDQEDITVEIQMSKDTSTADDGTANSVTKETGSPEENLRETILQSRESKGSEIPNVSEVKNLNPEVTMPNDGSGRVKTTKDEIPRIFVADMSTEGESSSDQNEKVNENNTEEMADSFLKSKTTDETSSENAVKEEMSYDGNITTGLPFLIETANEEIKERKKGDNAKNLSCSPLVTTQIEEISSEQVGLGNELHNTAEKASQEKDLDRQTMTAVISHEYELPGENESEFSFLKEKDDIHIQKGDNTVTMPEYSETIMEIAGKKSQEEIENQSKTLEENITIHTNPTGTEETEENALIQDDGSQMKHKVHLEKEDEKPCFTDASMRDTSDELRAKNQDEELRKAELSENKKDMESISVVKESTMQKYAKSLEVAPEEVESSISVQNTETTSSLEEKEKSRSANPQEILSDEIEQTFEAVDRMEETLKVVPTIESNDDSEDNSVIKEYYSEGKYEELLDKECEKPPVKEASIRDAIDDKSTYMQEDKFEDKDLRKAEQIENQTDKENTPLKEEKTVMKPIESLQLDPEDIRTYPSDHGTETTSLTASSQGNLDGITEDIAIENLTTIVSNEDIEEKSTIKVNGSQIKQEEYLEREGQIPFTIEVSTGKTSDDESIINHVDNTEHENLRKAELLETEKNTESTLLKKGTQMAIPIKSLQVVAEDIMASTSCQDTETSSRQERKLNPHENLGQKIEDKTINAADTTEKTPEEQNVTTIFSNENSKENFLIQMDGSNIKHEELSEKEGEILSLSETLVMESNNEESKVIHEDKDAESTLLKEGLQVDKPIESLKVGFEDIESSVSCQDQEATSSLMDQSITANPNEIIGEQTEEKISDAGDTKEITPEVQNFTTIVSNENAEKNSLIQVDASQKKPDKLFENERKIPALSETLTVETNNEESTVIQEDKIADEDLLKVCAYQQEESAFLKEEAQLDKAIKSLQTVPGDSKASTLCQDSETRSFLEDRSLTENPLEFEGDQAEDKIIDAADTKEKTSETHLQNYATAMTNENTEENSQQQLDGSQTKHEELMNRESKIPFLSETLEVKTNDEESKIINDDKNAEITLLKEEVQVGQPIESLQVAREEIEASVSCQDPETSSLRERSLTVNSQEIVDGQTEDKIIGTADIKDKTPEAQNFAPIFSNDNAENNSLIEVDASQRKQEELFEKERELPAFSETLMAETYIKESIIIHEEKTEDENIKKVAESESEKHIESTFLNEEAQVDEAIESLSIAPEDGEASASSQETETSFLKERIQTANSQEIEGNQTEHKIIDAANTKERLPEVQDFATILTNENSEENSLLQMDGSQMKHEELLEKEREIPSLSETSVVVTSNQESIIIHEKKYEDEDLQKNMFESEKHAESTLSKEEAHIGKPIESLQEAPEDNKASCQQIETTGYLVEQILIANTEFGDQTDTQVSVRPDTEEKTPEAQGLATIVSNEKTEENFLEMEREIPSFSEALIVETNNEESTVMHEDKIEDKDPEKIDQFESKKHAESNLLKEEVQVEQPTKSLQAALEEIEASVSCQDPATNSMAEQIKTANPQEIMGDQTEGKIIDTADTQEKTLEAQNSTTIVSNEIVEKNLLIQVDASQKKHEDLFENEREILALSEASSVETNNQESTVSQEDKIGDEDLLKVDVYEHEESTLLMEESQLDKPTESLQAPPGDSKTSASWQDTETRSFLEERSPTENLQEIEGEQTEDKTIDAANTKEKTSETHNFSTTVTNENIEENSLLQMDGSKKKHEELLNEEREISSLSKTLAAKTIDKESIITPEDKDAGSTLLKEEVQVDQPIENLQVALMEIEASVPCQDPETTCSLADTRLTENTQEIVGGQTEDKVIDTADIKEKTPEAHNSTTIVSNEDAEKNSLIQVDAWQKKHEDLFENEREVPALSEASTVEANNEESIIIHEDKIEDQDVKIVNECKSEKQLEITFLHEEAQADKPIKSLNVAPEDSKVSPSRQDTETSSFIEEQSLTKNPREIVGDQIEEKTIDAAANTREKTPYTQDFATIVTNDKTDDDSLLQMDGSQLKHEELLEKEREIPSSSETLVEEANNEESTIVHNDKLKDEDKDKFEDEDLKTVDIFEEKHAICISSVEESHVDKPIESLQIASEDSNASYQHLEKTSSPKEQSLTAYPQFGNQTEDKIVCAPDAKEKTCEAQGFTAVVSNENIEENAQMPVDGSQIIHEILETKREIPSLSETLTVKTTNGETTSIHEDKIEEEDLKNDDIFESEKCAESNLLKDEAWGHQSIESLQVAPEDIKAPAPCQDTETISSLEDQSPTANPEEIEGDQAEAEIIDASDTKEKTQEAQDLTTIASDENAENNSVIQLGTSQKKHEEQMESETSTLSDTLMVESHSEKSTIIHEDSIEDKDLKKDDGYKNAEAQVDIPIESLQAAHEDIKASPSCHDTEITSSLEQRSLTANPQEIVCDQTEDRIIDASDTEEEKPEAQDFATNVANDETEDNSLLEIDGSQQKHEELLEKEKEIPSSSETLVLEANNEGSTILHKDKSEDEDSRTVDPIENEKFIESTLLKEETKVGKHVESLQIAPEDIKASASCQERDITSTLMEQSLTANAQETVSEQMEDKIIATESIMDDLKHLEPTESDYEEAKCNVTLDQTMEKTKESTLEVEDHSTIERDLTTDREEMHLGRTTKNGDEDKDDEEEEEKGKKSIPDFSSKALITMEVKDEEVSRLAYDAADENFTSGVAEETNILNGKTEIADSNVMKREETQKDTLDSVKSIEGLEIISHDEDQEIPMTASKVIEVQEVGNLIASETSVLVSQSERAHFDDAQIGSVTEEKSESNEVDFAHRESTAVSEFNDHGGIELESREITTIENNSEKNGKEINTDDGTGYKTKNESVEEETQDDINYVPEKQELQGSVLLSKELPLSKMGKITYDGEANEESVELGEEDKLKNEVNPNYNARKKEDNDTVNSISKGSETVEPENMEVEDPNTKEDKLEEAAAEVKSDQIVAEDTLARKEIMKVYISTDEVKEETEGEKNYQGDEEKPEEDSRINTEEIFEAIQNADENKKVPKVLGEVDATDSINEQIVLDDKVVEEPDENIQANEPKYGSLHEQENETIVDQVTTGLDNKEKEHELYHQIEKTSIEDPREEVNSSILVFQEEEYNGTGANGTNNVMTKDAELLTMNNKNTSTTMTELQEDHESKQGSLPQSEVSQVQESEKQDKNDEIFSSDKVQGKEEEKMTISASKSDVEADKVDNLSRLAEDENNKNKIEVEKLDLSSHTKDESEISQNDHISNENEEAKVSNGGKEADIIQQDLVSNTVKKDIQEQHLENTVETVLEEKGMNSEEDEIKDDSCNDLQENSSSVDTDKVAPSNILQGSIGEEAEGAKSQETARQRSFLPILPHVKCSDMEIAQKDITLHLAKQDGDDQKEREAFPLHATDKPVVLEVDHTNNANTNSPIGSNTPMLQHGDSSGSSLNKGEKQEPIKFEKEEEKCGHEETTKLMKTDQSTEIDKHSLSDLLQLSGKETLQSADHFIVNPTIQKEDQQEEKSDEAAHEEAKTDEEKDDEGELGEHKSSDMSSDAPVMVDARDADVRVAHKKSHNILSGVGSKVKHSIAKVKKAITGKSSHPKSHSPKYGEKI